nr:MAG TPA: hypothetical protein [Caudoviricetes sp.]
MLWFSSTIRLLPIQNPKNLYFSLKKYEFPLLFLLPIFLPHPAWQV